MTPHTTREEWLNAAAAVLSEMIEQETDLTPAGNVLVSSGWPRRDRNGKVIGQCFNAQSGAGRHHVFISPMWCRPATILPVLLHELIHAADDCKSGHKGAFRKAWKALGFVGKPTTSDAGPDLTKRLRDVADDLGHYPSTPLLPVLTLKPQTTRMIRCRCEGCGYTLRTTQKWIDVATPICPVDHETMEVG